MKTIQARCLALCGLMVLVAAMFAPIVAQAQTCPTIIVECQSGDFHVCVGTRVGGKCTYNADCLNC
mgnify:CR=1 FL=1